MNCFNSRQNDIKCIINSLFVGFKCIYKICGAHIPFGNHRPRAKLCRNYLLLSDPPGVARARMYDTEINLKFDDSVS